MPYRLRAAKRKKLKEWWIRSGKNACRYCSRPLKFEEITVDHVIPFSLGGGNRMSNLVPACKSCNLKKANSMDHSPTIRTPGGKGWKL